MFNQYMCGGKMYHSHPYEALAKMNEFQQIDSTRFGTYGGRRRRRRRAQVERKLSIINSSLSLSLSSSSKKKPYYFSCIFFFKPNISAPETKLYNWFRKSKKCHASSLENRSQLISLIWNAVINIYLILVWRMCFRFTSFSVLVFWFSSSHIDCHGACIRQVFHMCRTVNQHNSIR